MAERPSGKRAAPPPGKEDAASGARRRALGDRLRDYYDEVAREPVPDEFSDLLKKLSETRKNSGGGSAS